MRYTTILLMVMLGGCATEPKQDFSTTKSIAEELSQAAASVQNEAPIPASVSDALLPPIGMPVPAISAQTLEQRFDLVVSDAPVNQVLMGIVSGTRYSMLIHPSISGNISVNLKDVTVFEALDAIRTLYGYEYSTEGARIFIEPSTMQTRVFQVNYITGQRRGSSDTRVSLGTNSNNTPSSGVVDTSSTTTTGNTSGGSGVSSSINTTTASDFWTDLNASLLGLIGTEEGRRVVINPHASIVVVHATPSEIRNVETFLRMMQINIERQVILEAKILSVELNDNSQNGINWAIFGTDGSTRGTIGNINEDSALLRSGIGEVRTGDLSATAGSALARGAATSLGGPLFAIGLQSANFATMLTFLETQGNVQVLSSPRIATINNQKAVLKVGTDEFFVTGVSTSTTASTGATTTVPEVTLQPFFSGITLDVTPQIDQGDNIILHIHPSVSKVTTVNKQISLGGALSSINLPLASSDISETDSIVRTRDGQIIAIGGLMTESTSGSQSKVPGLGNLKGIGRAFRQDGSAVSKSELVILLKSTVVQGGQSWADDLLSTQKRIENMMPRANNPTATE